mmetsp:Transcript_22175/g.33765  ORF Transcript_22175/g.33765 Transcript_22175/m.33765 type:complete len:532 (-) Transcript_22175:23-1618(-)
MRLSISLLLLSISCAKALLTPDVQITKPYQQLRQSLRFPSKITTTALFSSVGDGEKKGITLYQILDSNPQDSRSEIKKNYIKLVRTSHPDALLGKANESTDEEFRRITDAWKNLSDPLTRKRYDRTLRAQKFTEEVENVMGNMVDIAGPQFLNAFDKIALPLIRRSAATTVAGLNAVSRDIKNYGESSKDDVASVDGTGDKNTTAGKGVGGIIANAVKAGKEANKDVDRLELLEKARVLQRTSRKERNEADKMKEEINGLMQKRIQLTLHTPNAKLSSLEALMILDGFNIVDEVTMLDTMRLRHRVSYEIEQLEQMESEIVTKEEMREKIKDDVERENRALDQAKVNATAALQAAERARKALEDANALVASTKNDVDQAKQVLKATKENKAQQKFDVQRMMYNMERQQEKVRLALRRKEQAVQEQEEKKGDNSSNTKKEKGDFIGSRALSAANEVEKIIKQEKNLRAESARKEAAAMRLLSRSKKLTERQDELELQEGEVYAALEEGLRVASRAAKSGYGRYDENKTNNGS